MIEEKDKTAIELDRIRSVITNKIYGEMPRAPLHLSAEVEYSDVGFAAGRATLKRERLLLDLGEKQIPLPITSVIPSGESPCPAIIYIGYESGVPNKFLPAEEIVDRGYAIFNLCINDVSENSADFKSKIAAHIARSRRKRNAPGKLSLWAWGAQRVVEHIQALDCIDKTNIAVVGHGITAISALLCGASDDRIGYVIANDPFAALGPVGSSLACDKPYLFCPAYAEEPTNDIISPLLSLCSGKRILLGSAYDRPFANPKEEYKMLMKIGGRIGSSDPDFTPPCHLTNDKISYHCRLGGEYFSREDWNIYLDFIDSKIGKKP